MYLPQTHGPYSKSNRITQENKMCSNIASRRRFQIPVMESRDSSRDPFLRVAVLKVFGLVSISKFTAYRSRDFEYCKEMV